jgi:hypothetical protein
LTSVISSSPRGEGSRFFAISTTPLSYRYSPVTARLDFGFAGFSSMDRTVPPASASTTP